MKNSAEEKIKSFDGTELFCVKNLVDYPKAVVVIVHASDLIQEGTLAVSMGMKADEIGDIIHAHPTLSEAFHEAVLGINGLGIHIMPARKR